MHANVIYMDETTFQLWNKPQRTWMSREEPVVAPLNFSRLKSVTLFGAIGLCLKAPVFMMAPATNEEHFAEFLVEIARGLKNQYRQRKPRLVLDNHPAHRSEGSLALLREFFVVDFQPAYSSNFNCQETVWSLLKREFMKRLHRRSENIETMDGFRAFLQTVIDDVPLDVERLLRSNREYVKKYAAAGEASDSS